MFATQTGSRQNDTSRKILVGMLCFGLLIGIGPQAQAADVVKIGVPTGLSGANSVVAPSGGWIFIAREDHPTAKPSPTTPADG